MRTITVKHEVRRISIEPVVIATDEGETPSWIVSRCAPKEFGSRYGLAKVSGGPDLTVQQARARGQRVDPMAGNRAG